MAFAELDLLVAEVLEGEDLKILDNLSPKDKEIAWNILLRLRESGEYNIAGELWKLDFATKPPTPQEFLNSDLYLRGVGRDLYPKWHEIFYHIFDPAAGIKELIMRGCIGSGKSFMACVVLVYLIVKLLHYKNPSLTLQRTESATSPILLAIISMDLDQLEKNMWRVALNMLRSCPYVMKQTRLKTTSNYRDLTINFPKNIVLTGGSLEAHFTGQNLFAGVIDEANFRRSRDPQTEAATMYKAMRNRVENRFLTKVGEGFICLVSSEGDQTTFIEQHCEYIRKQLREGKKMDAHICQFAEWDIVPNEFSGETFRVDIGDNLRMPKILTFDEEVRDGAKIIDVPVEHDAAANRDLLSFLKDRAGIIPGRADKYFSNPEAALRAFRRFNPVLSEVGELGLDTEYEGNDYLDEQKLLMKVAGYFKPRENPGAPRYLHVDLAKNRDLAGFALVHIGDYSAGGSPIIFTDFIIGFRASAKKPIDYDKIIRLIFWLKEHGFAIAGISYDNYQGQHSMNTLDKAGFNVALRSVDRMKDVDGHGKIQPDYSLFREMLSEDRILLPVCPLLKREMLDLLDGKGLPDHPKTGSKDLIDALVGAVANLVGAADNTPRLTEENFFPIFGSMRGGSDELNGFAPPVSEKNLYPANYGEQDDIFENP